MAFLSYYVAGNAATDGLTIVEKEKETMEDDPQPREEWAY